MIRSVVAILTVGLALGAAPAQPIDGPAAVRELARMAESGAGADRGPARAGAFDPGRAPVTEWARLVAGRVGAALESARMVCDPGEALFVSAPTTRRAEAAERFRDAARLAVEMMPVLERALAAAAALEEEARLVVEQDVSHVREVVLPLASARATASLALCLNETPQRAAMLRESAEVARRIDDASAWASAEKAAVEALALAGLRDEQGALRVARALDDLLNESGLPASVRTRLEAESALVAAAALVRTGDAPGAADRLDGDDADGLPFATVLALGEARWRIALARAQAARGDEQRLSHLAAGFRAWEGALRRAPDAAWSQRGLRDEVFLRVGRCVENWMALERLPAVALVGWVWDESRFRANAEARGRAVALFGALFERADGAFDPAGIVRIEAERLLPRVLEWDRSGPDDTRWMDASVRFAEKHPDDGRAAEVLSRLCDEAERPGRGVPVDLMRRVHEWPRPLACADRLRVRLVRALSERAARHDDEGSAEEAVDIAEAISAGPARAQAWESAAWGWAALLARARAEAGEDPAIVRRRAERVLMVADRAARGDEGSSARATLYRADALLALGDYAEAGAAARAVWADGSVDAPSVVYALELGVRAGVLGGDGDAAAMAMRRLDALDPARGGALAASLVGRAERTIEPLSHRLDAWRSGPVPASDLVGVRLVAATRADALGARASALEGWALLGEGDAPGALRAFERNGGAARLGAAEAHFVMRDDERAFALYREIARADEAAPGAGGRDFWRAWTRMLEILARRPDASERGETILREIARLRALRSAPDHPDCLARLGEIERSLSRSEPR